MNKHGTEFIMGTANFYTMDNFPLYARDFEDYEEERIIICDIDEELEDINSNLLFHKIGTKSGYYSGIQFYVEVLHDLDRYEYDNYDCRYYFDLFKSQAVRRYKSEQNKARRILAKLAAAFEFEKYGIYARFSNGETWYTKIA